MHQLEGETAAAVRTASALRLRRANLAAAQELLGAVDSVAQVRWARCDVLCMPCCACCAVRAHSSFAIGPRHRRSLSGWAGASGGAAKPAMLTARDSSFWHTQ
jgi:hypothetical protein